MKREIITDIDKLHEVSTEVNIKKEGQNLSRLIVDMKDTLRECESGVGLSAIQVGENKRMFIINFNGDIRTFINPIIDKASGVTASLEGCLSFPGKQYLVPRYEDIQVFYQTPLQKNQSARLRGFVAKVFQHEYDHLVGITLEDIGLEYTDEIKLMSDEERENLVKEVFGNKAKNKGDNK